MSTRVTCYISLSIFFFFSVIPLIAETAHHERGVASLYNQNFEGTTANGEVFDSDMFTASHETLPFNTLVNVINEENGKSIIVRINDRGPYIEGHVIGLSFAAAKAIDMEEIEVAAVTLYAVISDTIAINTITLGLYRTKEEAAYLNQKLKNLKIASVTEHYNKGYRIIIPSISDNHLPLLLTKLSLIGITNPQINKKKLKIK